MKLNANIVKQQIESLKLNAPDLFEDNEGWLLSLESETDFNTVMSQIVEQVNYAKAEVEGIDEYLKKRIAARRDRILRREETLRTLAMALMQSAGVKTLRFPFATVSISTGWPKVIITDETLLTDAYVRIKREPDKVTIGNALKDGKTVAGAVLSNPEQVLTIRVQ